MVIFHFAALPVNQHFAAGLLEPSQALAPKPRRTRPDRLDAAWRTGFTAGQEDGTCAQPPAHYTPAEVYAFEAGRDSACQGAWDALDDLIDQLQDIELDRAACGF